MLVTNDFYRCIQTALGAECKGNLYIVREAKLGKKGGGDIFFSVYQLLDYFMISQNACSPLS